MGSWTPMHHGMDQHEWGTLALPQTRVNLSDDKGCDSTVGEEAVAIWMEEKGTDPCWWLTHQDKRDTTENADEVPTVIVLPDETNGVCLRRLGVTGTCFGVAEWLSQAGFLPAWEWLQITGHKAVCKLLQPHSPNTSPHSLLVLPTSGGLASWLWVCGQSVLHLDFPPSTTVYSKLFVYFTLWSPSWEPLLLTMLHFKSWHWWVRDPICSWSAPLLWISVAEEQEHALGAS